MNILAFMTEVGWEDKITRGKKVKEVREQDIENGFQSEVSWTSGISDPLGTC